MKVKYVVLLIAMTLFSNSCKVQAAPLANAGLIGVNLEGAGDGARARFFVDLAKTLRPWTGADGKPASIDGHGWPTADAACVLFDIRPFGAWAPPIDDPEAFQPDWSGTYKVTFHGKATLAKQGGSEWTVTNQTYDSAANLTRLDLTLPKNMGLLVVGFKNTQRTATSPLDSGITDLHIIRPGYPADTKQIFTTSFLTFLKPFSTLRLMDWLETNANPGYYGDTGHHVKNWSDRHTPEDATQDDYGGKVGVAWEYVIALANESGKDIWINIPVSASDDYIKNLAVLLKTTLRPGIHVYVEHSNEVWNFGFPQYIYNKLAAIDEVKAGGSTLNNDGSTDQEVWAHRRHAKRLVEISNIFKGVYGPKAINTTIRPVYASWTINPVAYYQDVLTWVQKTYGPPNALFYAVAQSHYFSGSGQPATATPPDILAAMRKSSDSNPQYDKRIIAIARTFGLKDFVYEGGSDTGGGDTSNVASRIRAERSPAMKELVVHDIKDNWLSEGGGLYTYFSSSGSYSRYGCWGLTEDIANLNTPKLQGIAAVVSAGAK
ncbi:MAG: hypothetical protein ACRYFS_08955 [Janthinobacterium lividum]